MEKLKILFDLYETMAQTFNNWESLASIRAKLNANAAEIDDTVDITTNQTVVGIKTFSSDIAGNITGNSATATALQTARTINNISFNGTANILLTRNINAQVWTTYTLVLTDNTKLVTMTNAAASTLTVPPNSSVAFPIGTQIDISQNGAGKLTVAQWVWVIPTCQWGR